MKSSGSLARVLSHGGEAENDAPLSPRVSDVLSRCQAGLQTVFLIYHKWPLVGRRAFESAVAPPLVRP